MLGPLIGDLLPSAAGVALSPVPVIAIVLMLDTPKARSNGIAFAAGWILGLTSLSVVVLLLAGEADTSSSTNDVVNWVKVVFGLLMLVLAFKQWASRPAPGATAELPDWMTSVDDFTAQRSAVLGAALSAANPKNLALTVAASATIAQAGVDGVGSAEAAAVFVFLGSITVAGPVVFYLLDADRAAGPLGAIKTFMSHNSNVIMAVVLLILGLKLFGDGFGALTA